jgi:hypothetical protein
LHDAGKAFIFLRYAIFLCTGHKRNDGNTDAVASPDQRVAGWPAAARKRKLTYPTFAVPVALSLAPGAGILVFAPALGFQTSGLGGSNGEDHG